MKKENGYEHILKHRKMRKQLMIAGFGGKCNICGYNKCNEALEFHHINPEEKEIALSQKIMSWEKTKEELKKCICVCANCHREIHNGLIKLDNSKQYFNEELVNDYDPSIHQINNEENYDNCPVCGKKKFKNKVACCRECYGKLKYHANWNKYDIIDLVENKKLSWSEIGRIVGVTPTSSKRHYYKIKGIDKNDIQKDVRNSSYGKIWVCNFLLKESIKIDSYDIEKYLNNGWIKGRIQSKEQFDIIKKVIQMKNNGENIKIISEKLHIAKSYVESIIAKYKNIILLENI